MKNTIYVLMVLGIIGLSFGIYNKVSAQEGPKPTQTPEAGDTAANDSSTTPAPVASNSTMGPKPTPVMTNGDRALVEDSTTLGSRDLSGTLPEPPAPADPPVSERIDEARPSEAVVILDEESSETKPGEAIVLPDEQADETAPREAVIVRNDEQQQETRPREVVVDPQRRQARPAQTNGATTLPEEPTVFRSRTRPALVREHIPGGTDADVRFIPNGDLQVREYTGNKRQANDDAVVLTNEK